MKPYLHAKNSVKRYGGTVDDYIAIHDFFDSTKSAYADTRHRAVLHSSFGIFLVEKVFGTTITNSDGRVVSVRDVGEDHVFEDCGFIPSIEQWLRNLPVEDWMRGKGMDQRQAKFELTKPDIMAAFVDPRILEVKKEELYMEANTDRPRSKQAVDTTVAVEQTEQPQVPVDLSQMSFDGARLNDPLKTD